MAAPLDKILASGHSPLPFRLPRPNHFSQLQPSSLTLSPVQPQTCLSLQPQLIRSHPGSGTSPTPTHSSSRPVICAQQLWAGPVGSKSHSNSSRPHKGLWRSRDLGTGTHLPSSPPPLRIFIQGVSTSSPWVGGSSRLPVGFYLVGMGGWRSGPSPELSSSFRIFSFTRSSHWRRICTASSMGQLSRRMLSMASSLSPGSRVPVLWEQGGNMSCWAHTGPRGPVPPPCRGLPHLCATLPFLMSEMTRGSPRFLLAAGGKKPRAHPWPPRPQGPSWAWTQSPVPCSPWLPGWVDCEQISAPLCLSFPSVKWGCIHRVHGDSLDYRDEAGQHLPCSAHSPAHGAP